MLFLAEFQDAGVFKSMLRTLLVSLCDIVYRGIIMFYQLFMAIGDATILTSADVQKIFNRVGLILGIIMMFRLIFSFVQYLLDPDKITDKETGVGGIIKKVIVVILALGLVNWVFEKAFELQGDILEENVIGKIVLGIGGDETVDMKEFGTMFSYTLFTNFYYQNPEMDQDALDNADSKGCGPNYFKSDQGDLIKYVATFGDFEAVHKCVNEEGTSTGNLFGNKVYYATFHGLEALIVGGFVLWVLIMYTISLGVRVVKLAFLRIIAPVPILSYLAPKKSNSFSNWLKQCATTYLDLFIRIAIIYFAMLLINIIFSRGALLGTTTQLDATNDLYKWFQIILVLGVLLFAKKLPEILGELFPGMNSKGGLDLGFGLKSRTSGLASRAFGAAAGAVGIGAVGALQGAMRKTKNPQTGKLEATPFGLRKIKNIGGGIITGVGRGAFHGAHGGKIKGNLDKAFHNQAAASNATNRFIAAGGDSYGSRLAYGLARRFGLPTAFEVMNSEADSFDNRAKRRRETANFMGDVEGLADSATDKIKDNINGNNTKDVYTGDLYTRSRVSGGIRHLINKNKAEELQDGSGRVREILGQKRVKNSDGSYSIENIYGNFIEGKKMHELDDDWKQAYSTAEVELKRLQEERGKLEDKRIAYDKYQEIIDNPNLNDVQKAKARAEQKQLNFDPSMIADYDERIADQSYILNHIDLTDISKKLAEAYEIDLIRGDIKDDNSAKQTEINFGNALRTRMERLAVDIKGLEGSKNPADVIMHNELVQVEDFLKTLKSSYEKIRADKVGFSDVFPDGKYEIEIPDLESSIGDDGKHSTKQITIENIHELRDEMKNVFKALKVGFNYAATDDERTSDDIRQSSQMIRERIASENPIEFDKH